MSIRISPKCWCVPIVVMARNEFEDGIAVDTDWFRMLWWHVNAIHGKNIGRVWGVLWRVWYWYVTEKNGTWGEELDVRRVQILEAKISVGYGAVNIG